MALRINLTFICELNFTRTNLTAYIHEVILRPLLIILNTVKVNLSHQICKRCRVNYRHHLKIELISPGGKRTHSIQLEKNILPIIEIFKIAQTTHIQNITNQLIHSSTTLLYNCSIHSHNIRNLNSIKQILIIPTKKKIVF